MMNAYTYLVACYITIVTCRDEDKISKACYWPNEIYEPCFGGCAEISCDNPRNHLRPCYPYCEPGCVCEEPYVRDDRSHQCVLPQDCSPTQMGIPVPSRRRSGKPAAIPKSARIPKVHVKHEDTPELNDVPPHQVEAYKHTEEVSRMGNYFNIVIAPPPIKALQPRKILHSEGQKLSAKPI